MLGFEFLFWIIGCASKSTSTNWTNTHELHVIGRQQSICNISQRKLQGSIGASDRKSTANHQRNHYHLRKTVSP
jgi:hypothetical protein